MTADVVEPVATICSHLDGIPLALELAAARTRVLTVDEIAARLDEQLGLLSRYGAADKRHQAMRGALDWSYELLEPAERRLFQGLSVFRGGATLEAVESVCTDPGSAPMLDLLEGLVAKSMLIAHPSLHGMRYRLLEPLRQYAEEKLGVTEEFAARHWAWYERFAREAEPKVRGTDQLDWLERVEAEHDNLRIALDRAFAAGRIDICVSIAGSLFWFIHSHVQDSEWWLPRLIDAGEGTEPRAFISLLLAAGQYSWELGRTDRARRLIEQALTVADAAGSQNLAAWGNAYAAILEVFDKRFEAADSHRETAAEMFAAVGSLPGAGFATWLRAFSAAVRIGRDGQGPDDDLEALLASMEPVVAATRRLGERNFLGHALWTLADLHRLRGDAAASWEAMVEGTHALHELGNKYCLAHQLDGAALLAFAGGDAPRAVRLLAASDALRHRLGTPGSPLEQRLRGELLGQLEATVDPEDLRTAQEEGRSLGIGDAVALVAQGKPTG